MVSFTNLIIQKDIEKITTYKIKWEKLKNKTVLVTGANGMLATYFIYTLMSLNINKNYNIKVIGIARNKEKAKSKFSDFLEHDYFKLLVQDIIVPINVKENVDFIIHAASNASPKYILSDPVGIIKANTLGTINVLEFAKAHKVENILYLSTREIYGKMPSEDTNIGEEDYGSVNCKELRACYPESKRMSETLLESYYYQYKIPFNIVRLAHVYGPGMDIDKDGRIMADLISDIVNDRDIVLKSDGSAVRAFCYISDAVYGMFKVMLEGEVGGAYNIANETEPIMIRDLAEKIALLFKERNIKVVYNIPKEQCLGYSKMGRTKLDTSKIEKLKWRCDVNLDEGLIRTVKSFEDTRGE